jgi:uncharacterized protein YuzE
LKVRYDKSVDAAYIHLVDEISGPVTTCPVDAVPGNGMINLDFDYDDRLVGIEVIPASKLLAAALLEDR